MTNCFCKVETSFGRESTSSLPLISNVSEILQGETAWPDSNFVKRSCRSLRIAGYTVEFFAKSGHSGTLKRSRICEAACSGKIGNTQNCQQFFNRKKMKYVNFTISENQRRSNISIETFFQNILHSCTLTFWRIRWNHRSLWFLSSIYNHAEYKLLSVISGAPIGRGAALP